MSGKVKCTCGWSWNKSDSSKKDMYICHECGRDNSNNMKNGGWLDSYDKAQDGIISPNVSAQDQYFEERNKEKEEYEKLIGNTGEELIDFVQRFIPGLRNFPAIGSTFAVGEAEANNQDASLSDELGMIPHPYTQAASLIALYAEKEKENFQKFAENKDRGKTYDELVREEEVNNKVIDNTYIPKPEIGELKGTKSKTKEKKIPYKEKKEVNEVQVDNTSTVKPRVDTNYKPKPKPKLVLPKISYKDNSFVMPKEINEVQIDNTYVAKPRLKNGGWLDNYGEQENYNDYKVSAPEGMVGDGFSNVGRNYSPAWGGQFQEGGEIPNAQKGKKVKPLYVESKNDPRYLAYKDSLNLHTRGEEWFSNKYRGKNTDPDIKKTFGEYPLLPQERIDNALKNKPTGKKKIITDDGFITERVKDSYINGKLVSSTIVDRKVKPGTTYYKNTYDKPQQQVIVNPKEVKPKEKLVPLQPMSVAGLQDVDNRFETNLNIPTPVQRKPKYYNITDVNNQYGGGDTSYRVDSLDELRELPKEQWDRKITPQYQMGGNIYPVNYVPQAQDGTELSEYDIAMRGMMKSKIGMGNAFGNPAIKRMSQAMPKTGMTPEGQGTHYMSSVDNYAVPLLQDLGEEELTLLDPDSRSREAIRFNSPEEAQYFAEHYKDVAPMSTTYKDLNSFQTGGSIPGSVGFTYARTQGIPSNGPYAKKTMASAQNGKEMQYYREGLDWKPKTISREGNIIKDDMGQWNHPGEITEINSPYITMQGVPYPVLGISDTGDMQMMCPEEEYEFDGEKVTEYPMAKNGLRQEQKGLVNLDNLLNFTNYNKPQPGGWLSKYE